MRYTAVGFVMALALIPIKAAQGQSVDAVVSGVVKDQTQSVVPGATVTASNTETAVVRASVTDSAGVYRLPPLPPGTYTLRAELDGFRPETRAAQVLHVGSAVTVDFTFAAVAAAGAVEVVGRAPLLTTTTTTLSRLVAREELDDLPVVDRNFNALASLVPGVTPTGVYGGVDIGGSRDFQNGYNVDGVSAEAIGAGDQRITYAQDWIQEFQVLTSQYSAEFGRASGGILNAITRSGSNATSGRAYAFVRDDAWDATPAFATFKLPLRAKRLGGTVGGRLIPNRLFFFGGGEWFDDATSRVVNSSVPERNGIVPTTSDQKVYIAKIDGHPDDSSTYRLRYNADWKHSTNVGVGGITTEEQGLSADNRAADVAASWSRAVSSAAFNEVRTSFSATRSNTRCNFAETHPPGTWFARNYPGALFGCPTGFGRKDTNEIQLIENFSRSRGAHDFKTGIQLTRGRTFGDFRFLRDGIYNFNGDTPFDFSNPASYPTVFNLFQGPTTWDVPWWSGGVFAQDTWRLASSVTLNAGVRYDLDGGYTALNPMVRVDKGLEPARLDANNVAPRVGMAWTPLDNGGRTLVRAGAGSYYDETHANITTLQLFNSILVERATTINAASPALNPFGSPAAARRVLAEALAKNTVPNIDFGGTANIDPDFQIPFTVQGSIGISHEFAFPLSASADAVFARGVDQYVIGDVNLDREAALGGATVRLNPSYTFINRYENDGEFSYRALQLHASFAPGAHHYLRLSYTLARNDGNTGTALEGIGRGGSLTNPFDPGEDFGPSNNDVRHTLSTNFTTMAPLDVQISGIVSARSGLPWSVAAEQLDADIFLDRPEARNSRRGDGFFSIDARVSRAFSLRGRRTAMAFVEVFNATNATNLTRYGTRRGSATFAIATDAFEKRRIQVGMRVQF